LGLVLIVVLGNDLSTRSSKQDDQYEQADVQLASPRAELPGIERHALPPSPTAPRVLDERGRWLHALAVATPHSEPPSRVDLRRARVVAEALDHAEAVMAEGGVGALTVTEVARRMGMRGPSLYKYFPSLHALYDGLFARGLERSGAAVRAAAAAEDGPVQALRAGGRAVVRWAVENPALAQLLFWRPVPGFSPSPEVFAGSEADMRQLRDLLDEAVRRGELTPVAASDDAVRTWTVLLSGLLTQQLANEPAADFEHGSFTRLTDALLDLFFERYRPD
jgi:AcrR family transcriptional regulator